MKVIEERKKSSIKFEELENGKVFFFEDVNAWGNNPYISIEDVAGLYEDTFNAIDLTDGAVVVVGNYEKVIPCEAILTIK